MFMAKQTRGRRRTSRGRAKDPAPTHQLPGGFWRQVMALLMIVISVVLIMTWFGNGGNLLNDFHSGSLYVVGYATYAIPVILVYLAVKIFLTEDNRLPTVIWVTSFLMILWLAGIFDLPSYGTKNLTGGVIGDALNHLVTQLLDPSVAAFIYIVLIFITGIFILQLSPLTVFKDFANLFRTGRKAEDSENARVARKAEREVAPLDAPIRIKANGVEMSAAELKTPKLEVKKASTEKPAEPEPERALTAASDPDWKMPSVEFLSKKHIPPDGGNIQQNAVIIKSTFVDFGIDVEVEGANIGPSVTQYTIRPPAGVILSKIAARDKELALNLATESVRIEAPIPGTRLVGVEIPNVRKESVSLRSLLESDRWKKEQAALCFAVGKDISGNTIIANLAKMPHLLIAGTTGSGKSVMTNILISSLLYRNAPSDMKLIIVDPKQVEMAQYNDIPHLLTPIITATDKALSAMKWAVNEMERRYACLAEERVKKIEDYNEKMKARAEEAKKNGDESEDAPQNNKMPYIVIIIDEMADLMMQAGKDLEQLIVRIAQKGRASGIHLVLATQRPEVKVVTGLIKANIPGRIAFKVLNGIDSRMMLESGGAEKLLGNGDMLMLTTEMMGKPRRIQGAFASDDEINKLTNFLREQRQPEYNNEVISQAVQIKGMGPSDGGSFGELGRKYDPSDPVVRKAIEITLSKGKFSTAMLQTYLGKGHGFVSGLAIWLEEIGVIGPANGNKPRDVMIKSLEEFDQLANS